MVAHAFDPSTWRHKQVDSCVSEASLIYIASYRASHDPVEGKERVGVGKEGESCILMALKLCSEIPFPFLSHLVR